MSPLEPNIRKPVAVKKKMKTTRRAVVAVSPLLERAQGAIGAQPRSLEGLEETRSNKEQVAPPKNGSL